MSLAKFSFYNAIGSTAWAVIFMMGGYIFGNIPAVKNNFIYVICGIIFVSLITALIMGRKKGTVIMSEK
jgi:membrane-associated protein